MTEETTDRRMVLLTFSERRIIKLLSSFNKPNILQKSQFSGAREVVHQKTNYKYIVVRLIENTLMIATYNI